MHQRQQRERRIAQPAIPVIPVSAAARLLRQRRRRRGNDPAGGIVAERLQRHQRSLHLRPIITLVAASARPAVPGRLGFIQRGIGIGRNRHRQMRRRMRQHEPRPVPGLRGERGDRGHPAAMQLGVAAQHHLVRSGDRQDAAAMVHPCHPRHRRSVFEAQRQIELHIDRSRSPLDDTDDGALFDRHEIDQRDRSGRRLEQRLQDHRPRQIAAGDPWSARWRGRCASGHCRGCQAAPRSRPGCRSAASTASRSIPPC